MRSDYSDYISKATRRLVDLLSSNRIRGEEKELYISSFTDNLTENLFTPENIEPYDILFARKSLLYIDDQLTKYKAMQPLQRDQFNDVVLLCERQKQNLVFLNSNGNGQSKINISDIDQFCETMKTNYNNSCFMAKTIELDNLITDFIKKITSYNDEECNYIFSLLNEMDKNITECKNRNIDYSKIKNADTGKIREKINNTRIRLDNEAFFAKVITIDERISKLTVGLEKTDNDPKDKVIPLLEEMDRNLAECRKRGINIWKLKNSDTDAIRKLLDQNSKRIINNQYFDKTLSVDKKISSITDDIKNSDEASLTKASKLLDELDTRIIECKERGISVEKLRNKDTNQTRKLISDYKQEVSDRANLYDEIMSVDFDIVNNCNLWQTEPNRLAIIVSLCDKCSSLLDNCKKRGWDLPKLKCINPKDTKNKYILYDEIDKTDKRICDLVNDISKGKYKLLIANVKKQKGNISLCSQNKWAVPELIVKDLDGAVKQHNALIAKKSIKSKAAVAFIMILLSCVAIAAGVIWLRNRYYETHTKMPISLSASVGDDYRDIVEELRDAGFRCVTAHPVSSGIQQSGEVIGITVNGRDTFIQNRYYSIQADIEVMYSSKDRIDITSLLDNWDEKDINDLYNALTLRGFDVDYEEVSNTSLSNNYIVSGLVVNGVEYSSGECYVPEGAEITLYYYGEICELEDDAEDLIGENYRTVRSDLMDLGFDNITFVRKDDLITGWVTDDGSIDSITINGDDDFEEGDLYFHNVEVVITVHTFPDREYRYIDD